MILQKKVKNNLLDNRDIERIFNCSRAKANLIIKTLNTEQQEEGFLIIPRKITKKRLYDLYKIPDDTPLKDLKFLKTSEICEIFGVPLYRGLEIVKRTKEETKEAKHEKGGVFNVHLFRVFADYLEFKEDNEEEEEKQEEKQEENTGKGTEKKEKKENE